MLVDSQILSYYVNLYLAVSLVYWLAPTLTSTVVLCLKVKSFSVFVNIVTHSAFSVYTIHYIII